MSNHEHQHGSCPYCQCIRLKRQHRGFILKHILRVQPIFVCLYCKKRFSKRKIKYVSSFKQDCPHTS